MKTLGAVVKTLAVIIGLAVLVAAVVIYSGMPQVGADVKHHPFTHWLVQTVRERSVLREARMVELQLPAELPEQTLLATVIGYEDMCAGCHAPPGRVASSLAQGLNPPAPDLAKAASQRSPAELFWVTRHGIRMTGMPAWGLTHTDEELWQLIALIREFPNIDGDGYERLLAEARAAGLVHRHDHDHHDHHGHDGHDPDHVPLRDNADDDHRHDDPPDTGEHDHDH